MEETNEPRTKEITHTGYPTKHPGRIVDCDLCMRGGEVERVGLVVSKEQADQLDQIINNCLESDKGWIEASGDYEHYKRGAVDAVFGVLGLELPKEQTND